MNAAKLTLSVAIMAFGLNAASAADMPLKARPAPPPPLISWTGCYVGIEAGGAWGRGSVVADTGAVAGTSVTGIHPSGGLAGGTFGCNYQTQNFVFGIENDISWSGLSGSAGDLSPFNTTFSHGVSTNWLDTLRGRAGIAVNNALFYVTGGAAFTSINNSATGPAVFTSVTNQATGWTVGAGFEYMFAPHWSAKAEYLYVQFPTINNAFNLSPPAGIFAGVNTRLTENIVRVGVNYKFDWAAPLVAKY